MIKHMVSSHKYWHYRSRTISLVIVFLLLSYFLITPPPELQAQSENSTTETFLVSDNNTIPQASYSDNATPQMPSEGDNTTQSDNITQKETGGQFDIDIDSEETGFEILRPSGAGSETSIDTQYPASGSHWDKVDEGWGDEDSTYIENKNGAVYSFQRDLYAIENHSMGRSINKVTIVTRTKFNAPSASSLKISLKTHGQVYDYDYGAYTSSVWTNLSHEMTINPNTGKRWTLDELDALEAGVSLGGSTYGPDWSRCTQVYVVVEYAFVELLRPTYPTTGETNIDTQYPAYNYHWDKVDEVTVDGDDTYVENKNRAVYSFQRDLYTTGNHSAPSNSAINKVTIVTWTKFNSPSASALKISLKTHGQPYDYDYGAYTQSDWTDISHGMTVNPYTNQAWNWTEIDDLEVGISLGGSTYSPDWSRCSQVYVLVDYSPHRTWGTKIFESTNITGVWVYHTLHTDYNVPTTDATLYAPTIQAPNNSPLEVVSRYKYDSGYQRQIAIFNHKTQPQEWTVVPDVSQYLANGFYQTAVVKSSGIWYAQLYNYTYGQWQIKEDEEPRDDQTFGWDFFEEYNFYEAPWPSLGKKFESWDLKIDWNGSGNWINCTETDSDNVSFNSIGDAPYTRVNPNGYDYYWWYVED